MYDIDRLPSQTTLHRIEQRWQAICAPLIQHILYINDFSSKGHIHKKQLEKNIYKWANVCHTFCFKHV